MAYPKRTITSRTINRRYGSQPGRTRALGPPPMARGKFFDPYLNHLYSNFKRAELRQDQQQGLFEGLRLPSELDAYLFPDDWNDSSKYEGDDDSGSWYGSAFNWTIDKLSRPMYAAAEATRDFGTELKDFTNNPSFGELDDVVGAPFHGAWEGLSGQKHTTFADVLRDPNVSNAVRYGLFPGMPIAAPLVAGADIALGDKFNPGSADWYRNNNVAAASQGLFLDIGLDPSTYIGIGLVGKAGSGARIFKDSERVQAAVRGQESAINELLQAGKISTQTAEKSRRLLTAEPFRLRFQKKAGAQAQTGKAITTIRAIAQDKADITFQRVMEDTLPNIEKLNTITKTTPGGFTKSYKGALRDRAGRSLGDKKIAEYAAGRAAAEVKEFTTSQMLEQYRTIVNADYKAALGLGTRKYRIPILPARAQEELAKIAQLKPLQIAADKTQKLLRNSYKIIEDVYRVKVEAMHLGRSATYMAGRYIDDTFKDLSRDNRKAAWAMGLQRESTNGEMMVRAPSSGVDQDAAELFSRHVDMLSQRVMGEMGELPFDPAELNRMLPPGLPPIFGREKEKVIAERLGLLDKNGKVLKGRGKELREAYQNQDWFRFSLQRAAFDRNIKGMKDGGHALWIATAAVEHAAARRAMIDNIAQAFGFSTKLGKTDPIAKALLTDLKGQGWREVRKIPELKDHVFNEEVAQSVEKMLKTMEDQREWGEFVKYINRITGWWKFLVTQPNPGYHIRNLLGDAFINWIDGAINPADYRAAARVLGWRFKGMEKFEEFSETSSPLLRIPGDPMENALRVEHKPLIKNTSQLRDAQGTIKPYILDSEIYAGINKHGIRQNYAVSQFGELEREINTFGTAFADVTRPVNQFFRGIGEWREDYMRISHFLHLVRSNPSKARTLDEAMQFAADRVRLTHFDYTDFTKFEQQIASNVFPFYKWTRKAVPLMARFMFEHPGKVIIPEKITRNLSGAFGYWPGEDDPLPGIENMLVPEWLKAGGYEPAYDTPGSGNPMFLRMPSPFSDILGFQGNDILGSGTAFSPQGAFDVLMQQSNPAIRIPYELSANRQTLFAGEDVPINNKLEYGLNQLPAPGLRQGLSLTGTFKDGEGNAGPLASMLTGFYSRELTERDQRNELYRQLFEGNLSEYENARIRDILRQRFGVDI